MNITQAKSLYTEALVAVYKNRLKPTGFGRSFFPDKVKSTKLISIMVQRAFEKVAVDCYRGTEGNRNQWTQYSDKSFEPLYFRENFDATQLQLYDRFYAAQSIEDAVFADLISDIVDHQVEQQEKIERAIEIMCWQILTSGIIQMTSAGTGIMIDYKRKPASLLDPGAGNYWADNNASNTPFDQIEAGCNFIRTIGKSGASTFNLICGSTAKANLYKNTTFLGRQNLFNLKLDDMLPPQRNALGQAFHGQMSTDNYLVNVWTYPQFYDNGSGVSTPYLDPKQVILIPETPNFVTAFGAVPQVMTPGAMPVVGAYSFTDWVSQEKRAHLYEVESCPLPIPVAVDTIYTLKAVA